MGLVKGTASFTRFHVEGELPDDYLVEFPKRISRFAFQDIDESSELERTAGWTNIMDMFDSDFANLNFLKEPCVALSWRVDTRKVPTKALQRYCRQAEERVKAAEELEYLPKPRRRDIRDRVRLTLLRRAIPASRAYDVIWNLKTGMLLFGATSPKLADEFAEFFLKCFDLRLNSIFPYSLAAGIMEKEGRDASLLDDATPTVFLSEGR